MNRSTLALLTVLIFCSTFLSSCQAIGDIFKAGVWVGIIGIGLVVFLILYFIGRSKK